MYQEAEKQNEDYRKYLPDHMGFIEGASLSNLMSFLRTSQNLDPQLK